jgi:hypothetical protein
MSKYRGAVAAVTAALLIGSFGVGNASAFRDRDCADFPTQRKAQKFFVKKGGPKKDRHNLDADNDGLACEDLP